MSAASGRTSWADVATSAAAGRASWADVATSAAAGRASWADVATSAASLPMERASLPTAWAPAGAAWHAVPTSPAAVEPLWEDVGAPSQAVAASSRQLVPACRRGALGLALLLDAGEEGGRGLVRPPLGPRQLGLGRDRGGDAALDGVGEGEEAGYAADNLLLFGDRCAGRLVDVLAAFEQSSPLTREVALPSFDARVAEPREMSPAPAPTPRPGAW